MAWFDRLLRQRAPSNGEWQHPTDGSRNADRCFLFVRSTPIARGLADAPASQPQLLFYQGWAEGGNYAIIERQPCQVVGKNEVTCAITVRDDLIAALATGFWVTDKFHLTVREGRIVAVRNSSNDPPEFDRALNWLRRERPDIMIGPCRGFFAGGPTPQDCVRAVVKGFKDYQATKKPD